MGGPHRLGRYDVCGAPRDAVQAVISDFGGVLTTPLFNAFAHVQEEQGIPLESLGMAMWRATQERGENPLFPLERGELSEPEFLAIVGAALSAEVGREVSMENFGERYFAQLHPNDEFMATCARSSRTAACAWRCSRTTSVSGRPAGGR
jgi:putative hydrolase of the HAD superfamily